MSQTINILCQEDNELVEASRESIKMMGTINDFFKMIEENGIKDGTTNESFPVEMKSDWFKRILAFCDYHTTNPNLYTTDKEKQKDPVFMVDFDKDFINSFMDIKRNHEDILELYRLGHYLNIPQIRNLVAKKLVDIIYNSNTPNDIRASFGFPPKETPTAATDASTASTASTTTTN